MKDTVLAATRDLVAAVDDLTAVQREMAARRAEQYLEYRGYQSVLERFPALSVALRSCRHIATGEGLAALIKPVPPEYRDGLEVRCVCGVTALAAAAIAVCPGDCGRSFVGDESGVWVVRLPEGDGGCECRELGRARPACLTSPECLS